jgi:hypothetical protein
MLIVGVVAVGILCAGTLRGETGGGPFNGTGTGAIVGQDVLGPNHVVLTTVGGGHATHLGKYTRTEELNLDPATGSFTGALTFTAANGDQVACTVTCQFVSAADAVGEYVITGGTGRFENASGSASFSASMTGATTFRVSFDGDITK